MNTEDVKLLRTMGIAPDAVTPAEDVALIVELRSQLAAAIESRDHWRAQATVMIENRLHAINDGEETLFTAQYVDQLRERMWRAERIRTRLALALTVLCGAVVVDVVWRFSR